MSGERLAETLCRDRLFETKRAVDNLGRDGAEVTKEIKKRVDHVDKRTCPNGPDPETGEWSCDPQGYGGFVECQACGFVGVWGEKVKVAPWTNYRATGTEQT